MSLSIPRACLVFFVTLPVPALGLRAAEAAPTVRITPPANARFAVDQAFDVRAEYAPSSGQTLTAVTLAIDGVSAPVSVGGQHGRLLQDRGRRVQGGHALGSSREIILGE